MITRRERVCGSARVAFPRVTSSQSVQVLLCDLLILICHALVVLILSINHYTHYGFYERMIQVRTRPIVRSYKGELVCTFPSAESVCVICGYTSYLIACTPCTLAQAHH
jgi:hypothetical protein